MITHQIPAAVVERAVSAVHEALSIVLTRSDAERVTQTVIDSLTSARVTVVLLPAPTSLSAHRETWQGPTWQIDSHIGGDIDLTTYELAPDDAPRPLLYELGAACIAAAIHNEENR